MRGSLDWSDVPMLKNVLARRLKVARPGDGSFDEIWSEICVPYYNNQKTLDLFISMSLMRPRNLLKLFNYCRGVAVNREKDKIEDSEIERGIAAYSDDILIDFSNEIRDLCGEAKDILYEFIGEKAEYSHAELVAIVTRHSVPNLMVEQVIEYMVYYGIFGILGPSGHPIYIFDVGYDIKKMRALLSKTEAASYFLHPALQPALGMNW